MSFVPVDSADTGRRTSKPSLLEQFARRLVLSRLDLLEIGQLSIVEDGRTRTFGRPTDEFALAAQINVYHPQFYSDVAFGGSIGAGEAYMRGYWDSPELVDALRILLRNRPLLEAVDSGPALLGVPLQKYLHWRNRNTRGGSRRNIAAHYDLGNDFYRLWLDDRMMYSSAYYATQEMSLDEASIAKLDRICQKLELSPRDSVIEVGTGWGGFAIHAAKHYGCHVTTTTISKQQFAYARSAIREAGLGDRITLLDRDYRDLEGKYDKLVSIEMIEAVGHRFHDTFFRKCAELLKDDGQMLLQAITIEDRHYEQYKKGVDFIRRYIFPGGCLTSVTGMANTLTRHTDMRIIDLQDIGPHYARTLHDWHERFVARLGEVRRLGYPDAFIRMWQFYLCYCESAFMERAIGDVQILLMRPGARPGAIGP